MRRPPLGRRASVLAAAASCLLVTGCATTPPPSLGQPARTPVVTPAAEEPATPQPAPSPTGRGPAPSDAGTPRPTASGPGGGDRLTAGPTASAAASTGGYAGGKSLAERRIPAGNGVPGGANTSQRIVLSYDDCPKTPGAFRDTILGAERLGVRIVVFTLGTCVRSGGIDVDFARQHGAFVFGHSVNHPQFTKLGDDAIRAQLRPPAVQGSWMRPPYGAADARVEAVAAGMGVRLWQWNLDTEDWKKLSEAEVVQRVVTESEAGDTVLMHLHWNGFSTDAIARMKDGLAARGLELCRNDGPVTATSAFRC